MKIVKKIARARKLLGEIRERKEKIGFVPTMGAFHEGHLSLFRKAKKETDCLVASIFVNPSQFDRPGDFLRYPRGLKDDLIKGEKAGVDIMFVPDNEEMYPEKEFAWVTVDNLSDILCGRYRPGHFRGVATVVAKLFNIVKPDVAFFGQKDAQQVLVIRKMVRDLNMDVKIAVCPTAREKDGLAMSSRNAYLNREERKAAPLLYRALREGRRMIVEEREKRSQALIRAMRRVLAGHPLVRVEYLAVVDPDDLSVLKFIRRKALIALAARIGKARLIDNLSVKI